MKIVQNALFMESALFFRFKRSDLLVNRTPLGNVCNVTIFNWFFIAVCYFDLFRPVSVLTYFDRFALLIDLVWFAILTYLDQFASLTHLGWFAILTYFDHFAIYVDRFDILTQLA